MAPHNTGVLTFVLAVVIGTETAFQYATFWLVVLEKGISSPREDVPSQVEPQRLTLMSNKKLINATLMYAKGWRSTASDKAPCPGT